MKQCHQCAARAGEAEFPERKVRGKPRLCCACIAERDGPPRADLISRKHILRRAQWRARERVRLASPQTDLIDWLQS